MCLYVLCSQVYRVLDERFSSCPWPVPPHAILRFIPIQQQVISICGKERLCTSEVVLRNMHWKDKKFKKISPWKFVDGPLAKATYFDDAKPATGVTRRHYVVHDSRLAKVSLVDWANFLECWSSQDLDNAANLMRAPCVQDLSKQERELYVVLRGFKDVLFLEESDGLKQYQKTLRQMYSLGLINLHVTTVEHDQRTTDAVRAVKCNHSATLTCLLHMQGIKRSLVASNREMKKKSENWTKS